MFSANPLVSTLLALGITLALIWGLAKALPIISRNASLPGFASRSVSARTEIFTVESITSVAPRRRVIVLRYGEQRLALLTGGPQDISLGWLPPPLP